MKTPLANFPPTPQRVRGFTLIETMIVLAIAGILASIAFSIYQSKILKTKRTTAQSCLMEYAQYMEVYRGTNVFHPMQYAGASLPAAVCATTLASAYNITLVSDSSTYTLTAAATGTQTKDTGCTSLTLQQDGTKAPASCWP